MFDRIEKLMFHFKLNSSVFEQNHRLFQMFQSDLTDNFGSYLLVISPLNNEFFDTRNKWDDSFVEINVGIHCKHFIEKVERDCYTGHVHWEGFDEVQKIMLEESSDGQYLVFFDLLGDDIVHSCEHFELLNQKTVFAHIL